MVVRMGSLGDDIDLGGRILARTVVAGESSLAGGTGSWPCGCGNGWVDNP
jgi:hypothetical protein